MKIKISVIKFEVVNGKKTGKSFSFEMDPKEMAKYKTEATVRKKIEDYVAKSGVFKRDELKDVKYSMKEFLEEWKNQIKDSNEEIKPNIKNKNINAIPRNIMIDILSYPLEAKTQIENIEFISKLKRQLLSLI